MEMTRLAIHHYERVIEFYERSMEDADDVNWLTPEYRSALEVSDLLKRQLKMQ